MTDTNTTSVQQAIATLANFPAQIDAVGRQVAGQSLGPWGIDVHCTYDSGCKKEHYSYRIDLSTQPLSNVLGESETHAKTFFTRFQPVTSWLKSTLPNFSVSFDKAAKVIIGIISEVGSGELTPAQRQELAKQFGIILGGLNSSKAELDNGVSAMATYQQVQTKLSTQVIKVKNALVTDTQAALQKMINWADGRHCGQSDARKQYNVIQIEYMATVNAFNVEFGSLTTETLAASNAVGTLIGVVSDFIAQINKVNADVSKVKGGDLPPFLKKVNLLASTQLWSELAKDAARQFGES